MATAKFEMTINGSGVSHKSTAKGLAMTWGKRRAKEGHTVTLTEIATGKTWTIKKEGRDAMEITER